MLDKIGRVVYNGEFCPISHEIGQSKDRPVTKGKRIYLTYQAFPSRKRLNLSALKV